MILSRKSLLFFFTFCTLLACSRKEAETTSTNSPDTVYLEKIIIDQAQLKTYSDSLELLKSELNKLQLDLTNSKKVTGAEITKVVQIDSSGIQTLRKRNKSLIQQISQLKKDSLKQANSINTLKQAASKQEFSEIKLSENIQLMNAYRDSLSQINKTLSKLSSENRSLQKQISTPAKTIEIVKIDTSQHAALRSRIQGLKSQIVNLEEKQKTQIAQINSYQTSSHKPTQERTTEVSPFNATLFQDSISKLNALLSQQTISNRDRSAQLQKERDSLATLLLENSNKPQDRIVLKTDTIKIETSSQHQADKNLAEAFRIFLLAKSVEKSDPTLAYRLNRHALSLSKDTILENYQTGLVKKHIFYQQPLSFRKPISSISFGADKLVAVLNQEKAMYYDLTDMSAPQLISEINDVSCAAISGKKAQMILGRKNGKISIYSLSKNDIFKNEDMSIGQISSVGIIGNPNYYWVIAGADKSIRVLDKSYRETARMVGMKGAASSLSINPSTGYIASACGDLNPRIWSGAGKLLLKAEDQMDSTLSVAISPGKNNLLSTHANGSVKLWSPNGQPIAKLSGHQTAVTSCAFGTEQLLATGDRAGNVMIWNESGTRYHVLKGHQAEITSLVFINANQLFSSSKDGTVRLWDLSKSYALDQLPALTKEEKLTYQIK